MHTKNSITNISETTESVVDIFSRCQTRAPKDSKEVYFVKIISVD